MNIAKVSAKFIQLWIIAGTAEPYKFLRVHLHKFKFKSKQIVGHKFLNNFMISPSNLKLITIVEVCQTFIIIPII